MRLSLLFCLVLFIGCADPDRLRGYLDNIPEQEEINASLYHYEIIVGDARESFSNKDYYGVFSLYEKYLEVFFEASVPREEELLYWVGKSVQELVGDGLIPQEGGEGERLFRYLKLNKERKKYLGIDFVGEYSSNRNGETLPQKILYGGQSGQGGHFYSILNARGDYEWEKKALREIYLLKFNPPGEDSNNDNLEHGYWLVTHYPDLFSPSEYRSLLSRYIDPGKLSKKRQEKWERIQDIFRVNEWVSEQAGGDFPSMCFPVSGPVVVYNRTHWISSRNLTSLELWEPFQVKTQVLGEDGQAWYAITFKGERGGFIDEENFAQSCEPEWGLRPSPLLREYFSAYQQFLSQDYLKTIEILSGVLYRLEELPDPDMHLMERSWTFFYQTLKEIAARSTSKNNLFTEFVQKNSEYFVVSEEQINLEVSDYFLKKIIEYDPNSLMLQYFDGFN